MRFSVHQSELYVIMAPPLRALGNGRLQGSPKRRCCSSKGEPAVRGGRFLGGSEDAQDKSTADGQRRRRSRDGLDHGEIEPEY